MTVIGTNVAAIKASNAANVAGTALANSIERLSTGKRINSAKDDAAGLSISSSFTSLIRGQTQAIRNASDGIALLQTADGALDQIGNILQRLRELAVQSASGTYSDDDRADLQAEVTQLTDQISVIQTQTNFNGHTLVDSSAAAIDIQTGAASGDTLSLALDVDFSNSIAIDIGSVGGATSALDTLDADIALNGTKRAYIGGNLSHLDTIISNLTTNVAALTDARSRIEDVDFSGETTLLARSQILSQASTALIAQANQSQQGVLQLLR